MPKRDLVIALVLGTILGVTLLWFSRDAESCVFCSGGCVTSAQCFQGCHCVEGLCS